MSALQLIILGQWVIVIGEILQAAGLEQLLQDCQFPPQCEVRREGDDAPAVPPF